MQKLKELGVLNAPKKAEILLYIVMLIWVFAVNLVAGMVTTAPGWPMFFISIFYFVHGAEVKHLPMIFVGALTGVLCAMGYVALMPVLAPSMGEQGAATLLLFVVLFLIFVGGAFVPIMFNNVAFAYLTIAAIDMGSITANATSWIVMLLVGGGILVGGQVAIRKVFLSTLLNPQKTKAT